MKVSVGWTTIVGWFTAVVTLGPLVVSDVEAGEVAFHGPQKWSALAGIVVLAITQVGRYVQAHAAVKGQALETAERITAGLDRTHVTAPKAAKAGK